MADKFRFTELVDVTRDEAARLGAGTGAANHLSDAEVGKFVKLAGESRYDLCAAGDDIQGHIVAMETATMDAYSMGTVRRDGRKEVTFDGSQADGTGAIAIGDIVVCGGVTAKGTALTFGAPAKVRKATTPANVVHKWRVISLGSAGTGAVGTTGLIEKI